MNANGIHVITIDGPSGTGKGTISIYLVRWLGWHFLDSGAIYRVLALAADKQGIALDDTDGLCALADTLDILFTLTNTDKEITVLLDGENVSEQLRTETIGNTASRIAIYPVIRKALLNKQRAFRKPPGLIADGRDMGTVVFPDATVKIYLTATQEERAQRRYKQLKQKGFDVNLPQLLADIAERDARDSERKFSPLKPAADAIIIDTTHIEIDDVVEKIAALVVRKIPDTEEYPR